MSEYEDDSEDKPKDTHLSPETKAAEKVEELRLHSELAAIFEGPRKFDARVAPGLDPEIARDVQRAMARFERTKIENTPVLKPEVMDDAARVLSLPDEKELPTGDYHVYRRPGEVMLLRWLAGEEQVDTFYTRYQAHCDAALEGLREDERSALEWRGDEKTEAYLAAIDKAELKAAERYLREPMRKHGIHVLSTTAADEMNIRFLCGTLMGVEEADLVGNASAPGEEAGESDLAWFFKLFSLRGIVKDEERMCFFAYLQKTDDSF